MKGLKSQYLRFLPAFLVFIFVYFPLSAGAHPLDISYTTIIPQADTLYGETYIHPYELNLLANSQRINFHDEKDIDQLTDILITYFKKHFQVYANTQPIELIDIHLREKSFAQILTDGIHLNFKIPKVPHLQLYELKVTLFITYFSTQINKLLLLDANGEIVPGRPEIYFAKNRQRWEMNLDNPDFSADVDDNQDTDKDGLSDHLEKLFGTDSSLTDSDKDGFTDFEEFYMGWDPLNWRSSKGQKYVYLEQMNALNSAYKNAPGFSDSARYFSSDEPIVIPSENSQNGMVQKKENKQKSTGFNSLLDSPVINYLIKCYQQPLTEFSILNLIFGLGIIFLFGLIHVSTINIEEHGILYRLTDMNQKLSLALRIIALFSLFHLSDMILGALLLAMGQHYVKWILLNPLLRFLSYLGLVVYIIFYLINGIRNQLLKPRIVRVKNIDPIHPVSVFGSKDYFQIFLTYLKPASLKWIILLFLVSTGKLAFILAGIACFGFGIFISLISFKINAHATYNQNTQSYCAQNQFTFLLAGLMMVLLVLSFIFPAALR